MLVIDSESNNEGRDSGGGGHGRTHGSMEGMWRDKSWEAEETAEMADEGDKGMKLWFQAA